MHNRNPFRSGVSLAMLGLLLSGALAAPGASAQSESEEKTGPGSAEEQGWELVFTDEFEREQVGDDWTTVDGKWRIKDGALRGSGTLLSARGFPASDQPPGYQRIEFKAATDVQPLAFLQTGADESDVRVSDLSSIIHAKAPEDIGENENAFGTGYFFQFGGFWNSRHRIVKAGDQLVADEEPTVKIQPDKMHHIIAENDKGHVRFFVDGELILEYDERMSLLGSSQNHVGFYFYTAAKVDEVKVYVKQLPGGYDRD